MTCIAVCSTNPWTSPLSMAMERISANICKFSISKALQFRFFFTESKPINPDGLPCLKIGMTNKDETSCKIRRCCSLFASSGILETSWITISMPFLILSYHQGISSCGSWRSKSSRIEIMPSQVTSFVKSTVWVCSSNVPIYTRSTSKNCKMRNSAWSITEFFLAPRRSDNTSDIVFRKSIILAKIKSVFSSSTSVFLSIASLRNVVLEWMLFMINWVY